MIYQAMLFLFSPEISYAISWGAGIAVVLLIYPSRVFVGSDKSIFKTFLVLTIYISNFLISILILKYFNDMGFNSRISIFLVAVLSVLINFFGMRLIYRKFTV
jgi:hypothetical protein